MTARVFLSALLVALLLPSLAAAQITDLEEVVEETDDYVEPYPFFVYGITAFGAFGTLGMQEINETITDTNATILEQGTTVRFDEVGRALAFGGGVRFLFKNRYLLEGAWERIVQSQTIGGVSAENKLDLPVNAYLVSAGFDFMPKNRDTRMGFSAGIGFYDSQAKQTLTETRSEEEFTLGEINFVGDTIGSHYSLFYETAVTERMFITAQVGYRLAKVDIEIEGLETIEEPVNEQAFVAVPIGVCTDAAGNVVDCEFGVAPEGAVLRNGTNEIDWSGIEGRVGFTYYFNVPTAW